MPVVRGNLSAHGAIIKLSVGVSAARRAMLEKHKFPVPEPVELPAQIDTGACLTAVSGDIFKQLQIGATRSIDVRTTSPRGGVTDPTRFDLYPVSVNLGDGLTAPLLEVMSCTFVDEDVIRALIGRDVLDGYHLVLDGPGRTFALSDSSGRDDS